MSKPRILIQLDPDPHASVFDAVVAADAEVDHLLRHGAVEPTQVRGLVHGAIFTRGPEQLHSTAIFIGGSDVAAGELLLDEVTQCFLGPLRVSVMLDASGANTTAAAAVLAAARHVPLRGADALVLAATGPVGQRLVRLLAREGARVRVGSRSAERADTVCEKVAARVEGALVTPLATSTAEGLASALEGVQIVMAAGAAGVRLVPAELWRRCPSLRVAIDLNAVPPPGMEGIEAGDQAAERDGVICYGAVGVGHAKMKIHKAAIRKLFESNDQVLDAEQILAVGQQLGL